MITPKISIITVVFNAAEPLKKTIENISSLEYQNIEFIVIDGGSHDSTPDVIQKYSDKISYYVSEPDGGLYYAMNKGIKAATGDYLWFINAGDTIYDSKTLNEIFKNQTEPADIYYGQTAIITPEGKFVGLRRKKLPENLVWRDFINGMVVCHQSIIVKREIAPLYNTKYRYAADIEWVLLCLKRASSIVNTHLILSNFEEGGISSKQRKASLIERFKIMKCYFGVLNTVLAHIKFTINVIFFKSR